MHVHVGLKPGTFAPIIRTVLFRKNRERRRGEGERQASRKGVESQFKN